MAGDQPPGRDRRRAILVMAASVVVVILVLVVADREALVPRGRPAPRSATPSAAPSPTPSSAPAGTCLPNQLQLEGAYNGCADQAGSGGAAACLPGAALDVFGGQGHLRDREGQYILYVEIDGGYHGPGTYPLVPWPHQGFGSHDGVAKVALREAVSGTFWQSTAGSVTIEKDQGFVFALLAQPVGPPTAPALEILGEWYCG